MGVLDCSRADCFGCGFEMEVIFRGCLHFFINLIYT